MKLKLKSLVLAGCLLGGADLAAAQTEIQYTNVTGNYDCSEEYISHNKRLQDRAINRLTGSDRRARREALSATKDAISRGYNYAIMSPWSRTNYIKSVAQRDIFFGSAYTSKHPKSRFEIACTAVPDEVAYGFLWGEGKSELAEHPNASVVDLRELLKTLEPGVDLSKYRVRKPAVNERNFKQIGQREAHFRAMPAKQAAAACYTNLGGVSGTQFRRDLTAAEHASVDSCIQGLGPQAREGGWDDFPAFVTAAETNLTTTGYTVNRPHASTAQSPSQTGSSYQRPVTDPQWGKGWTDISARYPQVDGVFRFHEFDNGNLIRTYVIASNTMTEAQLLDHAVYESARRQLEVASYVSGFYIQDITEHSKDRYATYTRGPRRQIQRSESEQLKLDILDGRPQGSKHLLDQNYRTVMFFTTRETDKICGPNSLVCTDGLRAYNTVGPRIQAVEHTPLTAPFNYKAFEPYEP